MTNGWRPPAGLAGYVDHVGVAVRDLAPAVALWRDVLGLALEGTETLPAEQVRVAMFRLHRDAAAGHLELLAPLGDDGPIARFLERRGPGLHHVAVAVTDMDAALAACRAAGLTPLPPGPRPGAGGKLVVFLHPRDAGGVLVELCARPGDGPLPAGA